MKFVFATNNGTKTPERYADGLASHGVTIDLKQVVTSALGASHMAKGKIPTRASIFVIGGGEVKAAGRKTTTDSSTGTGNSVLTAHVTNANGLDGPFADLRKLTYGDQVIVHMGGDKYFPDAHHLPVLPARKRHLFLQAGLLVSVESE